MSSAAEAAEGAARSLVQKAVNGALAEPRDVPDERTLSVELGSKPTAPVIGSAMAGALITRVARRLGPVRFMAKRTPMWLVAAGVPALYASISRGADELGLLASHLALRARAAGVEPDAERLRRAIVQLAAGQAVDPDREPSHVVLAVSWIKRAIRSALPFSPGASTRHPHRLATAAGRVDPTILRS